MEKYKYQWKIIGQEVEDLDKIIEQSGITATVTLRKVLEDIERLKKMRIETETKIKIETAKMRNVIVNAHSKLTTNDIELMKDEDLQAMFVYSIAWLENRNAENQLKEIQKAMDEVSIDLQEILKQTGLKITANTAEEITNLPVQKDGEN